MKIIISLLICYLIGSIPFGYVFAKLIKKIDLREYGSGNIGAANAFRILGPWTASLVLIGDIGKAFVSIYLMRFLNYEQPLFLALAGLAVICGHDWSVFLGFKGGKGIAATFGVLLALSRLISLIGIVAWLIISCISGYASLASISSLFIILIFMFIFGQPYEYIIFSIVVLIIAIIRHKENIKRLKSGQERKIFSKIERKK